MRERPALGRLADATLVQQCGHDGYMEWADRHSADLVQAINARARDLFMGKGEQEMWDVLSAKNIFDKQPQRLQEWLEATNSRRVVFGHMPPNDRTPAIYHSGKPINVDGGFSRFYNKYRRIEPITASGSPLAPSAYQRMPVLLTPTP